VRPRRLVGAFGRPLNFTVRRHMLRQHLERHRRRNISPAVMTQDELRNALRRAIVLEHQNSKTPQFPRWGWEKPPSLWFLRQRRLRLANLYSAKYGAVGAALLERRLLRGKDWPGIKDLVSAPIYAWVEDVWTHIGDTVPSNNRWRGP